ncbi:MAG: hypothetical protein RL398_3180 [Planctomycetota bacterium]
MAANERLGAERGVADRYRLRLLPHRSRGRIGDRRGSGVGSSMEFFDFRDYAPGDDLRHLDWRGYARTEKLRVRLHQEEVAPFVDVLVDRSASMAADADKERAVRELLAALELWCRKSGCTARLLECGGGPTSAERIVFDDLAVAPQPPAMPLRPRGVRVLVTDGLWRDDGAAFLHRLAAGAADVLVLQVLSKWEVDPEPCGALALVDVETDERREVQFDAAAVAAYKAKLQRLCDDLRQTTLADGGRYARVVADDLGAMCRRDLVPAEVLEPA